MDDNNDIWVFLSHSNKDYEKVRKIRDLLEEQNFRPLMFFLNCLNDDDEIDSLIMREIDSRKRFILCYSENAKQSKWVQKEVEYIKNKGRMYEVVDISDVDENIAEKIQRFKKRSTVYIVNSSKDCRFVENLQNELKVNDYKVFDETSLSNNQPYSSQLLSAIRQSAEQGYVIAIISNNYMKSEFAIKELSEAYHFQQKEYSNIFLVKVDDFADISFPISIDNIYNWIDVRKLEVEDAVRKIVNHINEYDKKYWDLINVCENRILHCPVPIDNLKEIVQKTGSPGASITLGCCYIIGHRQERNWTEAIHCFLDALECGTTESYDFLNMIGIEHFPIEGVTRLRVISVNFQSPYAQYLYGKCWEEGIGVTIDYKEAMNWYQKASKGGNKDAIEAINNLKNKC